MTVRERLLAIRLMEKEKRRPEFMAQIGVHVYMNKPNTNTIKINKEEKK